MKKIVTLLTAFLLATSVSAVENITEETNQAKHSVKKAEHKAKESMHKSETSNEAQKSEAEDQK